ncbi:hypothetical protein HU200_032738 [Digitaria exilis]|uniref:Uncharacterized protein n=1 Tax=Digitaria exilis TaxID=1010633 RepID=A0A835BXZ0_9POAL|nr:hypothetical protein HU200_032738 [Digitaria exilis]
MAEAAAQAQLQQQPARLATATSSDVVFARLQQVLTLLFPSNLAAKAALFALVVALLPLLPTSQASKIWELPHLLLLGIIISYGVFGQKNADAEVAAAAVAADAKPVDDEASVEAYVSQIMQGSPLVFEENDRDGDCGSGAAGKDGLQAWSSQYLPDDPLVVVADTNTGDGNAGEKPLLLPVRKLKPGAEESATLTDTISDGIDAEEEEEEEEEFIAPKGGYDGVRDRAIPSPSSVLDADLTLSPSSPPLLSPPPPPPPPPPFLGCGRHSLRKAKKARSFNEFGNRRTNEMLGLHGGVEPVVPLDDGEDDAVYDDAELDDEMVVASESSFSSDDMGTDGDDDKEEDIFEEDEEEEEEDGNSCDEELFELATRQGPEVEDEEEVEDEVEDEVDRKADEFIAKFREQIRMQRLEPATTRR